ncbi:centrosomal protein of 97 kDa isoform X6 [Procambarus clarkii]|uniref:centrosomal protein of 97 kDa isoform X6 n=1 Tax=Procambarus clarkii TaxID=6728 RepID=UPI0037444247
MDDQGRGEEKDEGQDDTAVVYDSEIVLDLCGRRLKRLEKAPANQAYATALVLDNNSLQNLANLDSYGELERLSIANNQVVRMYWFARMYSLRVLNLPNNSIVQVEGMRELIHLVHLNLAGNKLKTIEGLSYNRTLEHLNLSGNLITHVNDLSMLKNLKELFLHRNLITTLYRCNKYLPPSLIILTLSDNALVDLNDLSNLSHLNHLEQVTILNNPCLDPVQPTDESGVPFGPPLAFDYRPYVINWCLNLKVLDGYKVTPKESLKAEWLYSQGKGRGYQVGEHAALVQYLSGVCLAGGGWGGADLPDDDDKLAKILQLAKQHQHDLRHSVNGQDVSESSSGRGSRSSSHHDSPALHRRSVARSTSVRRNTEHSSQLTGSSKFVPAPESIMSPEFQAALATRSSHIHSSSGGPTQQSISVARSNSIPRSQRPPPSIRPTAAPQDSPRQTPSRSSSVTRPRASPMKSPAPSDIARGSPSRTARPSSGAQNSSTGPSTLPRPKPSPKPAPRYVRSVSVEPATRRPSSTKKKAASPHHGYSDADSDNTDSEMSISKLQTIKSIAAERKQTEKRGRDPMHSSHAYDPEKYRNGAPIRSSDNNDVRRRSSNSSSGSSTSDVTKAQAAITLQKHWRGYQTRNNDPNAAKIRDDIRHSRAEQHIKHLTEKLHSTEEALERERRLRHMQLDAIRTLWREIQKLQANKREGVTTPSTPITPLTPLTPLDAKEGAAAATAAAVAAGTKKYSEESVKELTEFCASLQGQVGQLQESLSMVTQVMNAFCNLPGSQSLLTMSQSSGSGHERSPGGDSPPSQSAATIPVPLSESVTSLTHSIRALTTSIVKSPSNRNDKTIGVEGSGAVGVGSSDGSGNIHCDDNICEDHSSDGSDGTPVACQKLPPQFDQFINPEMINSIASIASTDLNATTLDASTISVDSTEGGEADTTGRDEAELSESSQSSLSGSLSGSHSGNQSEGGRQAMSQGPARPSSLPVARPHTPRTTTS